MKRKRKNCKKESEWKVKKDQVMRLCLEKSVMKDKMKEEKQCLMNNKLWERYKY